MKVIITESYEWFKVGEHSYSFKNKQYEVEPILIRRESMGRHGAARVRYSYWAKILAPDGVIDVHKNDISGQELYCYIKRKDNKSFNPKKLDFIDNVATI